jgi:hypothetical protein
MPSVNGQQASIIGSQYRQQQYRETIGQTGQQMFDRKCPNGMPSDGCKWIEITNPNFSINTNPWLYFLYKLALEDISALIHVKHAYPDFAVSGFSN